MLGKKFAALGRRQSMIKRSRPQRGPAQRRDTSHWPVSHSVRQPPRRRRVFVDDQRDPLTRDPTTAALEAALFSADEPLSARRLTSLAGLPDSNATALAIEQL